MTSIEPYAATNVWDPPIHSQAVKVTGAQTIFYIAGQVAYDESANPAHHGDFKAQARAVLQALKALRRIRGAFRIAMRNDHSPAVMSIDADAVEIAGATASN
jgi:enamine deaminase RidA (YjgF/YER057c/UK114 family)